MSGASVFLMSCGTPEFRFPDDWMTTPAWAGEAVMDSHVSKWWSSAFPSLVHAGDIAVLVATKSGKVMGAFEVAGEPIEDRSHPHDPDRWPWTVPLRPLVLLDGSLAPVLRDFGLKASHKYVRVNDPDVAARLLKAIHPSLEAARARVVSPPGDVSGRRDGAPSGTRPECRFPDATQGD